MNVSQIEKPLNFNAHKAIERFQTLLERIYHRSFILFTVFYFSEHIFSITFFKKKYLVIKMYCSLAIIIFFSASQKV